MQITTQTEQIQTKIIWAPQPGPQEALVNCPLPEILFGGARGGGKTDAILGKYAIKADIYGDAFNAIFFRKEMPQADDLIERAKEIYLPVGAQWYEQKKMFIMPSGGRIRFRPLENTAAAEKYQGQNVTDAAVEEAGNYADSAPIDRLFGALRSKHGVPIQLILSANPGGSGQLWLKSRFIDPAPKGMKVINVRLPDGELHHRIFIPSKVRDNKILLANDPRYVTRLHLSGSPDLVKAWLDGDWNASFGAYFPEFGIQHIIKPFQIPAHWTRFCAMDWGYSSPFCVLWIAISDGSIPEYKAGDLIVYREWYGCLSRDKLNEGLKLTPEQVAAGMQLREDKGENIAYRIADTSIFAEDGGKSIAELFRNAGITFGRADKERKAGWIEVRQKLKGKDGRPSLYMFDTCKYLIETFPLQQHSEKDPEDMATEGADHALDTLRYGIKSRPYVTEHRSSLTWAEKGGIDIDKVFKEARRLALEEDD